MSALYGDSIVETLKGVVPAAAFHEVPRRGVPPHTVVLSLYPNQCIGDADDGKSALSAAVSSVAHWLGQGVITHILPPYVSEPDDHFAVIDDRRIDPSLGGWADLRPRALRMLDLVLGQLSERSVEYQRYLADHPRYKKFFYEVNSAYDLDAARSSRGIADVRRVFRGGEERLVLRSHGGTQVDLNYEDQAVLRDTLRRLQALSRHADWIRLDGVALLWKRSGTSSINLPESQLLCRLLSSATRAVRPDTVSVAEVDVWPGVGSYVTRTTGPDLVYNYAIPPAMCSALALGSARALAAEIDGQARGSEPFSLLPVATHDGITVRPWLPVLTAVETSRLVMRLTDRGLSFRQRDDGMLYEIHALVGDLALSDDPAAIRAASRLANGVVLALRGVPLLYAPSVLGLRASYIGSGIPGGRQLVRMHTRPSLDSSWARAESLYLRKLIRTRASVSALGADSPIRLRSWDKGLLTFTRGNDDVTVLCNFSSEDHEFTLDRRGRDLLTGEPQLDGRLPVAARGFRWIGH